MDSAVSACFGVVGGEGAFRAVSEDGEGESEVRESDVYAVKGEGGHCSFYLKLELLKGALRKIGNSRLA